MDGIRSYLISVICAAIICSIVATISSKKSANSAIIQMISGLFLAITMISPLVKIRLSDYSHYFDSFSMDAEMVVTMGEKAAAEEMRAIIISQTEAYILDKAVSMDAVIDVEVKLNDDYPPVPCEVTISGSVSPYAKETLSRYIANDLGISKEDQYWI